jgi:hypothetical protein
MCAIALGVFATACLQNSERDGLPSLVLSPSTALQGAAVTVTLVAPDVPLSECVGATPASLVFTHGGEASPIQVTTLEVLDDDSVRARLVIGMDAVVGDHLVDFRCDDATLLSGRFTVRQRLEDGAISLSPSSAKQGTFYLRIDITSDDVAFDAEDSHVVFGDGTYVSVSDTIAADGTSAMSVYVDIPPLTPVGPMDVAVVTGALEARGTFEILPRDTPWIEVDPDYIFLTGTSLLAQRKLTIKGNSVAFADPSAGADGGVGDGGAGTLVEFPENPGLAVTAVTVDEMDPSIMEVDIAAAQGTALGTTPLSVTTGGETVSAAFTVYPAQTGDAFMSISPARIERGVHAAVIDARVFGAPPLTEPEVAAADVHFEEEGCDVERAELLSDRELSIAVSADEKYALGACTIHVAYAGEDLVGKIAVVDPERHLVTSPGAIAQSAGNVYLTLDAVNAGGVGPIVFGGDVVAGVSLRSGVGVLGQWSPDDDRLIVIIDSVAADAPVGPARLHLATPGDCDITAEYHVTPSVDTPQNVIAMPSTVPADAREIVWHVESVASSAAEGTEQMLSFDAGAPPTVEFDDPAIRATSVEVLDDENALVHAAIGSGVTADMAVMYVTSGRAKAAASFLLESPSALRVEATDPEIVRGATTTTPTPLRVLVPRGALGDGGAIVGEVYDGVRVRILSADLYPDDADPDDDDELYLQLQIDADGPSGWFGVILTDGVRTAVLPLHVLGATDSLTMTLDADTADGALHPGDRDVSAIATFPSAVSISAVLARASTGTEGSFARLEEIGQGTATLSLDATADAVSTDEGIPIFLITGPGALVGFVPFTQADTATLHDGEATNFYFDEEWNPLGLLTASTGRALAYLDLGDGRPGRAASEATLLAADGLSPQPAPSGGLLWLLGDGTEADRILLRPIGDPAGYPSSVRLGSFGDALAAEVEGGETDYDEPDPLGDPCTTPTLTSAAVDAPLDEDWFQTTTSAAACDSVAYVVARALGERPWSSPDVALSLREASSGAALIDSSSGWPDASAADPRLYFHMDAARSNLLQVAPELGSAGRYFLHVRRDTVLREVCGDGGAGAFIEIDAKPGVSLTGYSVQLLDPGTGAVIAELHLSGNAPGDGVVVIGEAGGEGVDAVDTAGVCAVVPGEAFAVRLFAGSTLVDSLQAGGAAGYGEGDPASIEDEPLCFARLFGIDTNDNTADFIGTWAPTPGA